DDIPSVGTFQTNEAVIFKSSLSGERLTRSVITFVKQSSKAESFNFKLDASKQYQQIIGFGGAFTDATGINLNKLSPNVSKNIIRQYFSKDNGLGYTIGRVPMASCDFSTHEYSYDDIENDFNLINFNLTQCSLKRIKEQKLKYYITLKIPYILQAQSFISANEKLNLFASPWSAPAWMKTNGHMKGGGELKGEKNGQYYQTWSNYFLKFFEFYAKKNIKFWGMTIQNEPSSGLDPLYKWQTMAFPAEMERDFLSDILGPALKASNLTNNLKIMIYEDQRIGIKEYVEKVMESSAAAKYVDGVAYHWYEDYLTKASVLTEVHNAFPSLFQLNTEACTGYLPF
uniref:Glucosylceramidase n=2 Tax=Panagrolaimus sp. PS1159 TaxID=55785 RepID=A0AC35GP55_9BILA